MKDEKNEMSAFDDRGKGDLTFVIEEHQKEIWSYKQKEMQWIRTKNQLEGNKQIISELSKTLRELKSKLVNLEGLEDIHRKNNGDLRVHITKLEKENMELKRDNKYLAEKIESYRDILRKAGL